MTRESIYSTIFSAFVTFVFTLIVKRLEGKARLVYWLPHTFLFHVPQDPNPAQPDQPNVFAIQTNTLTIQNRGSKAVEKLEIIHQRRPDHMQFAEGIVYEESHLANGHHAIKIDALGPKELVTLQLLSYRNLPVLIAIRSREGPAKRIQILIFKKLPSYVYVFARALMFIGFFTVLYLLSRLLLYGLGLLSISA
ncbi:hypothetical protein OKW38_002466 [Paraburkholderia sp. MM5496-R1]|uniref:hypothetical protein n=1 Tax=Paraburkholderia sp. MM5496-R1 TaxID=2991065 RepID=UPI003D1E6370